MLTDNEDKVLYNLRDCVASNHDSSNSHGAVLSASSPAEAAVNSPQDASASAPSGSDACPAAAAVVATARGNGAAAAEHTEELFDPDDAESCDDLDGFLGGHAGDAPVAARDTASWDHVSCFHAVTSGYTVCRR